MAAAVSFAAGEYDGYDGDDLDAAIDALELFGGGEGGMGDDLFGDGEGGMGDDFESFMLDEELMETGMLMLEECGISLDKLMESGASFSPSDPSSAMDAVSSFLVKDKCPPNKESVFKEAMDSFETCTGIDLMEVIQTLPSALLGMDLMCLQSILGQVSAEDNSFEPIDLGEECAESLFGANPFGNIFRSLYLRPDSTIPCFQTLGHSLPDCTLPMWPMPVVGVWLKDLSCLVGASSSYVDDMCQAELEVLDTCLGQAGDDCNAATVECAAQGSSMFTLPDPMIGVPVSDACRRVADAQGMMGVVDRYEQTTHVCIQAWPGWEEGFTSSVAFKSYKAPGGAPTLSSSASGSTANAISKQDVGAVKELVDNTDSGKSGFSMFMLGVGSGLTLVGVAWAMMSLRRKGRGRRSGFDSVEMVESGDLGLV